MAPSYKGDGFSIDFIDELNERHHRQHGVVNFKGESYRIYLDSLEDGEIEYISERPVKNSRKLKLLVLREKSEIIKFVKRYLNQVRN